jgi:hypothetical protein
MKKLLLFVTLALLSINAFADTRCRDLPNGLTTCEWVEGWTNPLKDVAWKLSQGLKGKDLMSPEEARMIEREKERERDRLVAHPVVFESDKHKNKQH